MEEIIKSKKWLSNCPVCHKPAKMWEYRGDYNGIGHLGCDTCYKYFSYSGKRGVSKLEAIGAWNYYCRMYKEQDMKNRRGC